MTEGRATAVSRVRRAERGYSESVQLAVLLPVLMLCTLGVIQGGLWVHGHNVALRAAQLGVDEARGTEGSAERARDLAGGVARSGGLREVSVSVSTVGDQVSVAVQGRTPSMVYGLGRIAETAWAPKEAVSRP